METALEKLRILVLDDDSVEGRFITTSLIENGFEVCSSSEPAFGPNTLKCCPPDLIFLEIKDPLAEVQQRIYWMHQFCSVPLVGLVSADFVLASQELPFQVDQIVFKPFEMKHLRAVIQTLTKRSCACPHKEQEWPLAERRVSSRRTGELRRGGLPGRDFRIDRDARDVYCSGRSVGLSEKEFALLWLLVEKSGDLVSETEIADTLWPRNTLVSSVVIRQYVYRLRRKMEREPDLGWTASVETVRGRGYRIVGLDLTSTLWRDKN